ncbi:non-ribosomal peptide synthetase [Staphylococcus aureus]|uniref:Non-ribosomal peptide synthetase n=1 Tax=Staphylococcus aureus TaxID=1280 RepID=A0A380DNJ2_STAAU|nr:non-ribosomal peptide synthetase [Staphylococcus aureus]
MELASLLRREGLKIKFSQLIEHPTLNHWIETIKCIKIKKSNRDSKKENIEIDNGEFELTDVQRAYLIGREDDQELGGIGCHAYFEFSGKNIDTDRLNDSWYKVQMRHPMLRAVFTNGGKQWFMSRPYKENIEITNLEKCSDKEVSEILKKYRDNVSHIKRNVTKVKSLIYLYLFCLKIK